MSEARFLLDTQVFLWMAVSPSRLSPKTRAVLQAGDTTLLLSVASSWEIAIKYALGRLPLPTAPAQYVPERVTRDRLTPLLIQNQHALRVAELPAHHGDPFDRLLIAQAQIERLPIITADRQLEAYDVELMWAD